MGSGKSCNPVADKLIYIVLCPGDPERSELALHLQGLGFLLQIRYQGPAFAAIQEGGVDKSFVELEFGGEVDHDIPPDFAEVRECWHCLCKSDHDLDC